MRKRQTLHGLLSILAAGLFLMAGLVGYDSLMGDAGSELREVLVAESRVLDPSGMPVAPGTPARYSWGYTVALTVDSPALAVPEPNDVVRVQPLLRTLAEAKQVAASFPAGSSLQVVRSESSPAQFELANARTPSRVLFPALLCALGVLCLALSLRFGPDRLLHQKPPETLIQHTANSLSDVLEPRA